MTIIEYITTSQPTIKELNETPKSVLNYIKALEKALIEHIMK